MRSGDGAAPFGRNWGTNVLKPTTGHTASILRKSIEQESYRLQCAPQVQVVSGGLMTTVLVRDGRMRERRGR